MLNNTQPRHRTIKVITCSPDTGQVSVVLRQQSGESINDVATRARHLYGDGVAELLLAELS